MQRKELIAWDMECESRHILSIFSLKYQKINNCTIIIPALRCVLSLVVVRAIAFTPDGSTMAVGFGGSISVLLFRELQTQDICMCVCMYRQRDCFKSSHEEVEWGHPYFSDWEELDIKLSGGDKGG